MPALGTNCLQRLSADGKRCHSDNAFSLASLTGLDVEHIFNDMALCVYEQINKKTIIAKQTATEKRFFDA